MDDRDLMQIKTLTHFRVRALAVERDRVTGEFMNTNRIERADLTGRADIERLVNTFYDKIRSDDLLGFIFNDVAKTKWEEHLPKMYAFWNNLILALPGYAGAPFPPHTVLPVGREHFVRWVELFHANVDRHFSGVRAQRAKDAAASIAHTFALRLKLIDPVAGKML